MSEIAGLVREFPFGSFIILSAIWAVGGIIVAFVNIAKPQAPQCNCACCEEEDT
jgi:hypothetical protein